jgi:ferritin-like metal-binding protein YciE
MKSEVRELLTEELKDAYSAEKQALRCMQRALRKTSTEALREGIQMHIEQTQVQIERVEQAMEKMSMRPGRKVCEAMRGLVEEAQHEIEEHDEKGPILDLVIVAGMQRIEHYEIAAYGTDVAHHHGSCRHHTAAAPPRRALAAVVAAVKVTAPICEARGKLKAEAGAYFRPIPRRIQNE